MSQKVFENNLVAIHKNKVTLALKKQAYVGMCILNNGYDGLALGF